MGARQVVADTSTREVQGSKEQQIQLKEEMERTEVQLSLSQSIWSSRIW